MIQFCCKIHSVPLPAQNCKKININWRLLRYSTCNPFYKKKMFANNGCGDLVAGNTQICRGCQRCSFVLQTKLYIPSTLNIDLILWHTQLIVCAENDISWFKSWVFPFTFQAYHTSQIFAEMRTLFLHGFDGKRVHI